MGATLFPLTYLCSSHDLFDNGTLYCHLKHTRTLGIWSACLRRQKCWKLVWNTPSWWEFLRPTNIISNNPWLEQSILRSKY
jgi:hypothetical protein